MSASTLHLVVPGQVIASTADSSSREGENDDSFLRGHGTYIEKVVHPQTGLTEERLVASVCGMVQRVNKLITVLPTASSRYVGQVGDLVVGRIVSVGRDRWRVALSPGTGRDAQLPLTGIHLAGGVQRKRTAEDQRDMRMYFQEGDLVSAEIAKIQPSDASILLHTRSTRYGKLENGSLIVVPPTLIPRRKNHYMTNVLDQVDVLYGINGHIWIQRKLEAVMPAHSALASPAVVDLNHTDLQEKYRKDHATTPVMMEERLAVARFGNAIECLRMVHAMIVPEHVEQIYQYSLAKQIKPFDMLHPDTVLQLTSREVLQK